MSGPKRNPDKLNTIGVVVVGICGAVLVYVTIVALQAFYMNDTVRAADDGRTTAARTRTAQGDHKADEHAQHQRVRRSTRRRAQTYRIPIERRDGAGRRDAKRRIRRTAIAGAADARQAERRSRSSAARSCSVAADDGSTPAAGTGPARLGSAGDGRRRPRPSRRLGRGRPAAALRASARLARIRRPCAVASHRRCWRSRPASRGRRHLDAAPTSTSCRRRRRRTRAAASQSTSTSARKLPLDARFRTQDGKRRHARRGDRAATCRRS